MMGRPLRRLGRVLSERALRSDASVISYYVTSLTRVLRPKWQLPLFVLASVAHAVAHAFVALVAAAVAVALARQWGACGGERLRGSQGRVGIRMDRRRMGSWFPGSHVVWGSVSWPFSSRVGQGCTPRTFRLVSVESSRQTFESPFSTRCLCVALRGHRDIRIMVSLP